MYFFFLAMFMLTFLISLIGVLLGIAFLTLMERKIMGLMHYRKGPNKVVLWGISQPISDAMKLLTKENLKIQSTKLFMFNLSPILGLFLLFICWMNYESTFSMMSNKLKFFIIMSVMSLTVFMFILACWGSNSKYSLLGGYRTISQVISYEVCFVLFLFTIFYMSKSYNFFILNKLQENFWIFFLYPPLFFSWVLMCMAESNRTPFDLSESESELVSGFNIEYGGGLFAVIFIVEYGMIMFMSFLSALIFLGSSFLLMKTFIFCLIYIWIRCSFPRVRYDKLMNLCWKTLLPFSLCLMLTSFSVFFILLKD